MLYFNNEAVVSITTMQILTNHRPRSHITTTATNDSALWFSITARFPNTVVISYNIGVISSTNDATSGGLLLFFQRRNVATPGSCPTWSGNHLIKTTVRKLLLLQAGLHNQVCSSDRHPCESVLLGDDHLLLLGLGLLQVTLLHWRVPPLVEEPLLRLHSCTPRA